MSSDFLTADQLLNLTCSEWVDDISKYDKKTKQLTHGSCSFVKIQFKDFSKTFKDHMQNI